MRSEIRLAALSALLLLLAACGKIVLDDDDKKPKAAGHGDSGLTFTAEQSEALGLTTAKLQAVSYRAQLTGYGNVLAIDTIAQLDADIASAEAVAAQSAAAAARAKDLASGDDAAVSRETWETAAAKAATDQAAVTLAQRKADVAFGIKAPWRNNAAQRNAVLARLQSGRTLLVKVTFPIGAAVTSQNFNVSRVGNGEKNWISSSVWEAPADATFPGRSLFALVEGSDLAPGERLIATLGTGVSQQGVLVPATALVLGESDAWAYVKTEEKSEATFMRVRIDISHPQGDGYFVATGLEPEQEVVTTGAGLLYAREVNPSVKADAD